MNRLDREKLKEIIRDELSEAPVDDSDLLAIKKDLFKFAADTESRLMKIYRAINSANKTVRKSEFVRDLARELESLEDILGTLRQKGGTS